MVAVSGIQIFPVIPQCADTSIRNKDGGKVAVGMPVQLLFWGREWPALRDASGNLAYDAFTSAARAIVEGPWMSGLRQYGVRQCSFGGISFITATDPPRSPSTYDKIDIEDMIQSCIDGGQFPEPDEPGGRILYVAVMPPGTQPAQVSGVGSISGEHDSFRSGTVVDSDRVWYAFVCNNPSSEMVRAFSHELAEMCVDPEDDGWKVDGASPLCEEIGDLCNSRTGPVSGVQNVEAYWSVRENACVIPTAWSVRRMLAWAGRDLPPGQGLRSLQDPMPSLKTFLLNL
jgi:hypothetical protein